MSEQPTNETDEEPDVPDVDAPEDNSGDEVAPGEFADPDEFPEGVDE